MGLLELLLNKLSQKIRNFPISTSKAFHLRPKACEYEGCKGLKEVCRCEKKYLWEYCEHAQTDAVNSSMLQWTVGQLDSWTAGRLNDSLVKRYECARVGFRVALKYCTPTDVASKRAEWC